MTPEEVFAQLRDIHAPATATAEAAVFDFRPLLVVGMLVVGAAIFRIFWRWVEATRVLSRIKAGAPKADQRDALVRLLDRRRRRSTHDPAPAATFQPPEHLTTQGLHQLRRWVGRRIR